jgi:hypothetical protein
MTVWAWVRLAQSRTTKVAQEDIDVWIVMVGVDVDMEATSSKCSLDK